MVAHRKSIIAGEGWPLIIGLLVAGGLIWRLFGWVSFLPVGAVLIVAILVFRDPRREIPPIPLGIVSPVDGRVMAINTVQDVQLPGRWTRLQLSANPWGAYTVRSPIEGAVLNMREQIGGGSINGLWLRSEENDEVVLLFPSRRPMMTPKAFVRCGERLGQGQRFAYLRLAPAAELFVPATASLRVAVGDRVKAGCDVLADLASD